LSSNNAAKPTFTAPQVSANTNYTFSLLVNDGFVNSVVDQVIVTVKHVNKTPIANAGIDQSVDEGTFVTLDGSISADPDGSVLTYTWTAPAGVSLSSNSVAKPTFTAPQVSTNTNYTFSLVVNDGSVNSVVDQVIVTVKHFNPLTLDKTLGNTEVFASTTTGTGRRAMPYTFAEAGEIQSISIYHGGGTGNLLLGVYSDLNSLPSSLLGASAQTAVSSTAGWQTVELASPVSVSAGQTIWLSWVFQNSVVVRYTSGTPGRAQSSATWTAGMPASFGSSSTAGNKYSIYCTYTPVLTQIGYDQIYGTSVSVTDRRAMPVTFTENGDIKSISIYHNAGSGNVFVGVYANQNGLPSTLLGIPPSTVVSSTDGGQTVLLSNPVSVATGQTVWLAWVFQNGATLRYTAGTPGRAVSSAKWANGLSEDFGSSSQANYKYSVYCTYTPEAQSYLKSAEIALGVEEEKNLTNNDLIYPNPTTGIVNMQFGEKPESDFWISVYNSSGALISKINVEGQEQAIDLSGNPPGIYLIKIDQKNSKTYKVILQ